MSRVWQAANSFARVCLLYTLAASVFFGTAVTVSAAPPTASDEIQRAISEKIDRVPEIVFLQELAKKHGVRAWLFGGTAAAFAHYVKWDLLREQGDARYQKEKFDYDYFSIFRPNQDFDVVIDGSPQVARAIEAELHERFRYLKGNKSTWEVRLLRQKLDDKEALLGSKSFLNQHTDSNSTGMIDVSDGTVRDLRDWKSKTPFFLEDVALGKLHYYFSDKHETTSRFKKGLNPPIFSVIRFLTKAFQYGLTMRKEDVDQITSVVRQFKSSEIPDSGYVRNWLEKNVRKMIENASNVEEAYELLKEIGLFNKLVQLGGDRKESGTLAWWLKKEPLPTLPFRKNGKTAAALGITEVAHETRDLKAYESITRSPVGLANVFTSRQNVAGEAAALGNGFYTRVGRQGARGTGLTIRFRVDPKAREGHDFIVHGDYVVFKNKRALQVVPESMKLSVAEYLDLVADEIEIPHDDRALLERWRRRAESELARMEPAAKKGLEDRAFEHLKRGKTRPFEELLILFGGLTPAIEERLKATAPEYPALIFGMASSSQMPDGVASRLIRWAAGQGAELRKAALKSTLTRALDFTAEERVSAFLELPLADFPPSLQHQVAKDVIDRLPSLSTFGERKTEIALKHLRLPGTKPLVTALTWLNSLSVIPGEAKDFLSSPQAASLFHGGDAAYQREVIAAWKKTGTFNSTHYVNFAGGNTFSKIMKDIELPRDEHVGLLFELFDSDKMQSWIWNRAMEMLAPTHDELEAWARQAVDRWKRSGEKNSHGLNETIGTIVESALRKGIGKRWLIELAIEHGMALAELPDALFKSKDIPAGEKLGLFFRLLPSLGDEEKKGNATTDAREMALKLAGGVKKLDAAAAKVAAEASKLGGVAGISQLHGLLLTAKSGSGLHDDVLSRLVPLVAKYWKENPDRDHNAFGNLDDMLIKYRQSAVGREDPRALDILYDLAFIGHLEAYEHIISTVKTRDKRYLHLLVHIANGPTVGMVSRGWESEQKHRFKADERARWMQELWDSPYGKKHVYGMLRIARPEYAWVPEAAALALEIGQEKLVEEALEIMEKRVKRKATHYSVAIEKKKQSLAAILESLKDPSEGCGKAMGKI